MRADLAGRCKRPISEETWKARRDHWFSSEDDRAYVRSCMVKVHEHGKFANWIAPPAKGINRMPIDFEYVRTEG